MIRHYLYKSKVEQYVHICTYTFSTYIHYHLTYCDADLAAEIPFHNNWYHYSSENGALLVFCIERCSGNWGSGSNNLRRSPATSFHATVNLLYRWEIRDRIAFTNKFHTKYNFLSSFTRKLCVFPLSLYHIVRWSLREASRRLFMVNWHTGISTGSRKGGRAVGVTVR